LAARRSPRGKDSSELALFLDMLTAERGAAAHTVEAYTRDLADFLASLAVKGKVAKTATADHIRAYLAGLARKGLAPTSRARKLSAIRQFFRFLLGEGLRADDPCSAIDSPKLGRPLPKILSLADRLSGDSDLFRQNAREQPGFGRYHKHLQGRPFLMEGTRVD
jgi:integrase/recombinase XerD